MPQLDPTSFPSQLFWLAVSVTVLYLLLAYALLPRMQNVLRTRADTINGDVASAARMKAEAEAARAAYEKALADARARSDAMLAQAQAEIRARMQARGHELAKETDRKLAESDAAIRAAKQDALSKLSPASGELTTLIVEMLVHHKPTSKEVGAAISGIAKERAA